MREYEIKSWERFRALAAGPEFRSWAFRGQGDARPPLYTTLSRYLMDHGVHRTAWPAQEERILRIFRRKSHLYLDHVPDLEDAFQWLALMQHHGAPTRLLDFTWSPYVAAFFALEHATGDAAVWALCPRRISECNEVRVRGGQVVRPREVGPWHRGNYERYFLPGTLPVVVLGEPLMMNRRLVAQSATFAMPGVLDEPVESILADYPAPDRALARFVLRTECLREQAMRELYSMNITHATLFPDLDGLARSMAYELEFNWAFDPKTLERYGGEGDES